jgi:DNA-binding response OmpR family regulator
MRTILLIDDNPDILMLYAKMMQSCGYEPITAIGSDECQTILSGKIPDFILLDIMMSPVDGWRILEKLKADDRTSSIPVLILTAKIPTFDEISRYIDRIDDYIMKPLTREDLCTRLSGAITRSEIINARVDHAKRSGIDPAIIEDYRRLSKKCYLYGVFSGIIPGYPGSVTETREYLEIDDFKNFIENYKEEEQRFKEIRRIFEEDA